MSSSEVTFKCELKNIRTHLQLHGVMQHGVTIGTIFSPCWFGICYCCGSSVQNIFGHDVPKWQDHEEETTCPGRQASQLAVAFVEEVEIV